MPDPSGWVERWVQRVLTWFSQKEVKTPLAFYFRLITAVTLVIVVATYFGAPEQRFKIFLIGIYTLGGLAFLVALFAWFKVKNLVYGESGHRAETRFKFGTEKREIEPAELATLPGTENPRNLPEQDVKTLPDAGGGQ